VQNFIELNAAVRELSC